MRYVRLISVLLCGMLLGAVPTRVTVRDYAGSGAVTTFPAAGKAYDVFNNAMVQSLQQYADDRAKYQDEEAAATITGAKTFLTPFSIPAYTQASLLPAGTAGRLARMTDDVRGVWIDTGSRWVPLNGGVINATEIATGGAGTDASPWTGWDDATTLGYPVRFRDGVYSTSAVLADASTKRIHWLGAGIVDATTSKGTKILGTGVGTHVLKAAGTRYVVLEDLTLDANSVKDSALIIDGPSVVGYNLKNVRMIGAVVDTFDIAPTANTQVSEAQCHNCFIQSAAPTSSQIRVRSTNALDLAFHGGVIAGAGPYNIRMTGGSVTLYDPTFSNATTADIFFETESPFVKIFGGHTETTSKIIHAPAAAPAASYDSAGTVIVGFTDAATKTTAITHGQTRPMTIIESRISGDIALTSPAILYSLGLRMLSGKVVSGTGFHVGMHSLSDALTAIGVLNKLNVGTTVTANQNPADVYLHHQGGLRWTNSAVNAFGGQVAFRQIASLADLGVATLALVGSANNPIAIINLTDSDGNGATFMLRGGNNATVEMADSGGVFSVTAGTASSTNIYYSVGNARYELENRRGATKTYTVFYMSATA